MEWVSWRVRCAAAKAIRSENPASLFAPASGANSTLACVRRSLVALAFTFFLFCLPTPSQITPGSIIIVNALPSFCYVGQVAFLTTAAAGSNLYGCKPANTWTLQAGSTATVAIGSGLTGGTTNYLLYVGSGPVLAQEQYIAAAQMAALTGDVIGTNGSLSVTVTKINGTAFSGTLNHLVSFGSGGNTPADSGLLISNVALLGATQSFSGVNTFSGNVNLTGLATGTQASCLGLTSGNAVVASTGACGSGSGSGTVTSFSAGTLSPLFTTSVATATTTPVLSFSLSNAAADTIFGNNTSSSAAPAFNTVSSYLDTFGSSQGDILYRGASEWTVLSPGTANNCLLTGGASANPSWGACSGGSGGTSVSINGGSALTSANFNSTTPAAGSGYENLTWQVSSSSVSVEVQCGFGFSGITSGCAANTAVLADWPLIQQGAMSITLTSSGVCAFTGTLPNYALTAYTAGMAVDFIPDTSCATPSLNVAGNGAISIYEANGSTAGATVAGTPYRLHLGSGTSTQCVVSGSPACVWLQEAAASASGTVTSFSAGTLSPLFTTSVATATTTPALSFSLSNAAGNTVFGNPNSTTGAPSYYSATITINGTACTLGGSCTVSGGGSGGSGYSNDQYPQGTGQQPILTQFPGTIGTLGRCSSGASPAVCAAAPSGVVAVPTGVNPTLVVDSSAVTTNSQIMLTFDASAYISGTTCNTTAATLAVPPYVSARTAGTSFTISYLGTISTNPACIDFLVIN